MKLLQIAEEARGGKSSILRDLLDHGLPFILPTDTVPGIAVAGGTPGGLELMATLRGKDALQFMVGLCADRESARRLMANPQDPRKRALAEAFWPGPLMLQVEAHASLPQDLAPEGMIFLRVPGLQLTREIVALAKERWLLWSTVPAPGRPYLTSLEEILIYGWEGRVAAILWDPEVEASHTYETLSTVVRLDPYGWRIIHVGPIPPADIAAVLETVSDATVTRDEPVEI